MGKQYAIDFTIIEIGKIADQIRFECYLADSLYYLARHQALQKRYIDLLPKEDNSSNRSGDEIVSQFLNKWEGDIN